MTFGDYCSVRRSCKCHQKGGGVMVTTQEDRLQMAIDRLVSCRHPIVALLSDAGWCNLALWVEHDLEALATLGTSATTAGAASVTKEEVEHESHL